MSAYYHLQNIAVVRTDDGMTAATYTVWSQINMQGNLRRSIKYGTKLGTHVCAMCVQCVCVCVSVCVAILRVLIFIEQPTLIFI